MTIEVHFILPGVAAALLVLTFALHILRLTRQAQHCPANIPDPRPFRVSAGMWVRRCRIDYASARLPLRDAAANQWHLRSEFLVLREGEQEPPPMKSIEDRVAAAIAEALVIESRESFRPRRSAAI